MKLTAEQKLAALSHKYYQHSEWIPKAGDYYTTSRNDLELYQVVRVENGTVTTRYTEGSTVQSDWPLAEFTSVGFGKCRVWVPSFILMDLPTKFKFHRMDPVQKRNGYLFPGLIVSAYETLAGHPRYVVECTEENVRGCQHIFNGDQLVKQ